ncbi:MAG TPA: alpha/beta hydrolase, partial [Mycobacteriales bacterium]|nr:alpha/beta hydrolase [Mycobacteriales bacterium]
VVLCLPGLTGPTTVAAAANRHVADRVAREGVEPVLAELARDPAALPWIADEVARSWRRHDPASLVAALRAAGDTERLPDGELSRIAVPAGIAAVVDDLAHPLATAEHLARTLPRAALRTLSLVDLAADRSRLGRAAVAALAVARDRAVPPSESR